MKSDVRWQVRGVRRQARETAREAARRSGMSVGQWLDSVITDTAMDEGATPQPHDTPAQHAAQPARYSAPHDFDPRYIERAEEQRRMRGTLPGGPARWTPDRTDDARLPRPLSRIESPSSAYQPAPVRPAADEGFAEVKDRLDDLKRQLESIARPQSAVPQHASGQDEAARQFADVISKLDHKLDQLITDNNATKSEIEQRMQGVKRAVADLDPESQRTRLPAAPATPLDQALLEIADRQRTLDEPPSEPTASAMPPAPAASPSPAAASSSDALPRALTQEFSGLEQQLRQINSQIEMLNRPCGLDKAVDTLRDDLAEIGVMLQDAMPRKAVEALESEMRKLADRIDQTRQTGTDAPALANLEQGLAEVRDALRSLTPAESLAGLGEAVKALSHKVELIAGNSQDPAALKQLEGAIVAMRGIVTHVASNDALANLAEEVRALSAKVDQATSSSGGSEMFAMLERRIGTLADALEARNQNSQGAHGMPPEFQSVVSGLIDRIENIQVGGRDQTALGHLEDRIAKLVEKLDASDHRLNHLEAIERGLAELLIHLEHQRLPNAVRGAGGEPAPEVDALLRDVTGLKQMERKTQDSLESVHGALEDVVGRLATIETDFRDKIDHAVNIALASAPVAPPPMPAPAAVALRTPVVFAPSEPAPPQPKPTRSVPMQAAVAPAAPVAETVPHPAPTALAPAAEPFPQAPEPIEFAPEPPRPNPAPTVAAERRPIDPSLPPDHPLEPGATRGRSPADRIAASEAAFGAVKPPVIPDPAGKSNFIAAARRAAQAAASEPPARTGARATEKAARVARPSKFLAPLRKHARALIIGFSVLAIVLGSLNIVKNWLAAHEEAPATSTSTEAEPKAAEPAPAPRATTEAPATPVQPVADRQSSLLPAPSFPPPSGTLTPREVTGSIEPTAAAPVPAPAPAPAAVPAPTPTPAPAANARPSASPAPSTVAAGENEKLPTGITGALRAAAAKGDPAAQFEVAMRFSDGRGVPQNLGLAAEWFERAAKQGSAPAQFRLGGLYEKGLGVKKNLDAARRLYIQAGEAGNAKALHNLAVLYAEGMDGKPDYQSAAQWFRKAAAYGMSDSLYNLGVLYARGVGVEQNLAEAYRWFALAAREGDKESEKKRDDLASRLDPQSLKNARAVIDGFKPEAQPEAATTVKTPSGGWDAPTVSAPPAAPATPAAPPANKRRSSSSGPKMEAQIRLDLSTPDRGF